MKARILLLAVAASAMTLTANAQEVATSQNKPGMYTTFARDKASDHWFIDVQGGIGVSLFGYNRDQKSFGDRLNITPTLAIGKWHEPYFGTRVQFMAWEMKGFNNRYVKPGDLKSELESIENKSNYVFGHFDFMFDLCNYFGVYRPNKVFHVIPFVGVGAGYKFAAKYYGEKVDFNEETVANFAKDGWENPEDVVKSHEARFTPAINAGLMLKFKLSKVIDINLEAQTVVSRAEFFGTKARQRKADITSYATAGLTFNLGKSDWEGIVPMDYNLIKDLNSTLSALRAENEELSKRPASCPECPEVVETEVSKTVVSNVVYFKINSAKIRKNQEINIFNTAQYAKDNNQKITIVGYADKNTGTAAYNMKLSERRAKAVAKMLTDKFGVSPENINIEWKGSDEQVYAENAWNRIVIMNAE